METPLQKDLKKNFPVFYKTCLHLQSASPLYKNVFTANERVPVNYQLAEEICSDALAMSGSDWSQYTKWLSDLSLINMEFLKLQISLEKSGRYLYSTFKEVEREVFKKNTDGIEGVKYLRGLYFTQIFWATHHRMFNFFLTEFVAKTSAEGICLEAPCGSGVFLGHFLSRKHRWSGVGVDLSDTAIALAQRFFEVKGVSPRAKLIKEDINDYVGSSSFNAIMCGEFLEHVEDPLEILKKLHKLLVPGGRLFLTTVAWAAFIDHIYLYKNAGEIRDHIAQSGFTIEKEYIQNIFPRDARRLEESGVALNYAAVLTK